jgi:predicted Zn-ribbon and HTH transcriptional regulator
LGYVEGALVRAGIKFINITGGSFWQSRHVADVIGYLRLAHDTSNKEALEQVYNIPSASHQYAWDDAKCKKCKGTGISMVTIGTADDCPKCKGSGYEKPPKFKAGDYCPTRYLGKEFLAKISYNFNNIDKLLLSKNGWRYQTKEQDYSLYGPTKAQDLQEFVWGLKGVLDQADNVGQIIRIIIDDCYEKYLRSNDTIGDEGLVNAKLEDLATVEDLAGQYTSIDKFLV